MVGARPGQWELLGESGDPLPGDAAEVTAAAKHYSSTATAIRAQVARLRQIGEGSNQLVGKYQPALQKSAEDLADHLDDAEGRFDTVSSELGRWAPVLSDAYTQTGSLLSQAESAQQSIDANQPPDKPVDKTDDAAVKADKERDNRLTGATGDLTRIVRAYDTLMNEPTYGVKAVADDVAKKIDDASHDSLKDSFWDGFRKWIHDNAGWLKLVADVLTWIATAIIIVVLVVGTGGMALVIAAALLGGALLIHSVLAANGDGSWVDVALDVFALVTLGLGTGATAGARAALGLREGIEAFSDSTSTARAAFANASGFFGKAGTWLRESNALTRTFNGLKAGKGAFTDAMKIGEEESLTLSKLVHPSEWGISQVFKDGGWSGVRDLLVFGDKGGVEINNAVNGAIAKYGSGTLLNGAKTMLHLKAGSFLSASTIDGVAKTLNPAFPGLGPDGAPWKGPLTHWSEWAEEHTVPHGGYW